MNCIAARYCNYHTTTISMLLLPPPPPPPPPPLLLHTCTLFCTKSTFLKTNIQRVYEGANLPRINENEHVNRMTETRLSWLWFSLWSFQLRHVLTSYAITNISGEHFPHTVNRKTRFAFMFDFCVLFSFLTLLSLMQLRRKISLIFSKELVRPSTGYKQSTWLQYWQREQEVRH